MRDYSKLTKTTPERYCEYCGKKLERKRFTKRWEDIGVFNKRKYCDRMCMRKAFVKKNGEGQMWGAAHHSARNIMYLVEKREKRCEICGSIKNIDVHHKDGDFNNNTEDNLMLVCRSCHNKLHRPKSVCKVCGKPVKGNGYCNAHYIRWKKFGDPLHYYHRQVEPQFIQGRTN